MRLKWVNRPNRVINRDYDPWFDVGTFIGWSVCLCECLLVRKVFRKFSHTFYRTRKIRKTEKQKYLY